MNWVDRPTSIELFAGAGGLAMGVAMAGFDHEAVLEYDHDACESLRLNASQVRVMRGWPIVETDVRDFEYAPFQGDITLLSGGPPCQPFSLGGKHQGHRDERNMFPEVFRALAEVRPQAILLENVKGLLRPSFRPYFNYIVDRIGLPEHKPRVGESWRDHHTRLRSDASRVPGAADVRYDVQYRLVNAADFGTPQRRERVIIVAFRSDLRVGWTWPRKTHSSEALEYSKWVDRSYWTTHGLRAPDRKVEPHSTSLSLSPIERPWRTVRDAISKYPAPRDSNPSLRPKNHVGIPGARSYAGHTGSPLDEPAKTLKAGDHGVPGGENMLRDDNGSVRYFTVREAAALQDFPDSYEFRGTWTESMRQLGNAVPVRVARVFATSIRDALVQAKSNLLSTPAVPA